MLDKKTRAVLAYLETQCPGGSFKVLEKQDIVAAMPARLALTAEEIDSIVAYLDRSEFVVLKYLDEQQMCLTLTPKAHSALLDEKDPIDGRYNLEVSSPGLDRPLTKLEHFARFAGFDAKIETDEAIDGRKRFKGKIVRTEDNGDIVMATDTEEFAVPFAAVAKAKLLLTDELLAAAAADDGEEPAELEADEETAE